MYIIPAIDHNDAVATYPVATLRDLIDAYGVDGATMTDNGSGSGYDANGQSFDRDDIPDGVLDAAIRPLVRPHTNGEGAECWYGTDWIDMTMLDADGYLSDRYELKAWF